MSCKRCGGALRTEAGQMIGVCTGCIQGLRAVTVCPGPGYSFTECSEPTEPERPE
jgi:hypothetical protein